jgi:hypothetical protein
LRDLDSVEIEAAGIAAEHDREVPPLIERQIDAVADLLLGAVVEPDREAAGWRRPREWSKTCSWRCRFRNRTPGPNWDWRPD